MKHAICSSCLLALLTFLLAACAAPTDNSAQHAARQYGQGSVVAVWDLENFSITENLILDNLQEFLTSAVADTLKEQGGYVLIERQKLLLALEELQLGSSVLADEATQLEIGRILGAQLMVFGGYQQIGEQVRIDLRMIEVETGAVLRTAEQTVAATDATALLTAAKTVAGKLL